MKYARVSVNLLDLWIEPRYNSERASQLLFNEPVKIGEENNGYWKIEQTDGYTGWADKRFLKECSQAHFNSFEKTCNYLVTSAQAKILDGKNRSIPPQFLFYGTKIKSTRVAQKLVEFRHPSGGKAYLKPINLKPINRKDALTSPKALKEAKKWLGVPYLWGGITPAGFDCSGFVRQVFAQFGVYLPRDTKDQILVGQEVERRSIKIGDLVFFKRHVGIALNSSKIIHCSVGSNGVRIESIEPGEENYRPDLDANYVTTRRII